MPREPTLAEVIRTAIDSRLLDAHTTLPGRVVSYAPATQTAEVEILVQHATPNADEDAPPVHEAAPVIPNVPVVWPNGGGCYLHFPLAKGDEGMLVFSESSMGQFRETGELSAPGDLRRHSMSSAVFLPVRLSKAKAFPDPGAAGEAVLIVDAGVVLRVSSAGGTALAVAHGPKVDAELDTLKSMLTTLVSMLATWAGTFNPGGAPGAATGASGAAAVVTATGTLTGQLGAWPSASVEATKLTTE